MNTELINLLTTLKNDNKIGMLRRKYINESYTVKTLTSFLDDDAGMAERVYYVINGLKEKKKCACGCGEPVNNAYSKYINLHQRRDPEKKKEWSKKMQETMKSRWYDTGRKHEIYDKVRNTVVEKYGTDHVFQSDDVKEKIKKTMIEKYGHENCSQNADIKEKKRISYKKRYECEFNQSAEVNNKIIKSRHKNTYKRFERFSTFVQPLFEVDDFHGGGDLKIYDWQCMECKNVFKSCYDDGLMPKCSQCKRNINTGEEEIYIFLTTLGFNPQRNTRRVIAPLELDLYIPEKNLAIEFNGIYWHQLSMLGDKNYHKKKTDLCKEKGVKLVHIFEDEWNQKKEIVKSRLKNILKCENLSIFARKCKIVTLTSKEKNEFLLRNHIQGSDNSSICYGLFNKEYNEIVSIMTFGKPRFSKNYQYELIRFCSELNMNVVGGASKLLSHFIKNINPDSLLSYSDLRWSNESTTVYEKIGFEYSHTSEPNYWYFKGNRKYSRYLVQKHKLSKILKNFDSSISAEKNLKNNNFMKLYDCGNLVYVWKNNLKQ